MKRAVITGTIIAILLLTACAAPVTPAPTATAVPPMATPQPTPTLSPEALAAQMVDEYLNGEINYPTNLPDDQKTAFESALMEVEPNLPMEQQKRIIEDRFEPGSTAFEAVIKADGNLEYYDGNWKTLEAMRNLNNEIIPWGVSYDMVSEEGRNGILTNIMAGNETVINEHIHYAYDISKENQQEEGFDTTDFNLLYVQFFPDVETINFNDSQWFYSMKGQIVVKNDDDKIYVIDVVTCLGWIAILHTFVKSETVFQISPSELCGDKGFEKTFLAILPKVTLDYRFYDDPARTEKWTTEPAVVAYLEKVKKSNLENFINQLEDNPNSISDDIFYINGVIYPTH